MLPTLIDRLPYLSLFSGWRFILVLDCYGYSNVDVAFHLTPQ